MNLSQQVAVLLAQAKAGASPDTLAEMIVGSTPEDKLGELEKYLSQPDLLESMIKLNPEVANYRQFFEELRDSVLQMLDEGGDEGGPAEGDDSGTEA